MTVGIRPFLLASLAAACGLSAPSVAAAQDAPSAVVANFTPPVPDNRITLAEYPPESVEAREQGRVVVNICVAPDGHIDEVRLVQSSGYPRLDSATIVQVTANFGYSPAMQGDTPVRACFDQPIDWGL